MPLKKKLQYCSLISIIFQALAGWRYRLESTTHIQYWYTKMNRDPLPHSMKTDTTVTTRLPFPDVLRSCAQSKEHHRTFVGLTFTCVCRPSVFSSSFVRLPGARSSRKKREEPSTIHLQSHHKQFGFFQAKRRRVLA